MRVSDGHGDPRRHDDGHGPEDPARAGAGTARARRGFGAYAVLPVVSGVAFAGLALSEIALPEQRQPFAGFGDYLIEACFTTGLWCAAGAVLMLDRVHRRVSRWGWFGRASAIVYAAGTALLGVTTGATLINGGAALAALFLPGIALWLLGGVLLAAALLRARLLPRPLAVAVAAALPLTMAIGSPGPVVLGAVWLALGAAIARLPAAVPA
jgi:hypothetical protein